MKVLIVSQYFWPETFGINAIVAAMHARGVGVTVLTGQPNYPDGAVFPGYRAWRAMRERLGETEVIRVPLFPRGHRSAWRLALNYVSFVVSAGSLGPWLLRGRHFDIIFVYAPSPILQTLPAILLARLRRKPLVLWVQDLWPESLSATGFVRNRKMLGGVAAVVRFIYSRCDAILIQSRAFRHPVERLTDRADKIHYHPNSVELPKKTQSTPQVEALAALMRNCFSVVFAGNLGTAQSLDTIVDAAEILKDCPNVTFFLVGSGSCDAWLAAEIECRKLENIVLTGRIESAEMPTILASAATLLVTLKAEEIFDYTIPSKVQAYLAAARPIVAALNGEGARIVEESGAGLTCPAGDAVGLARSVKRLYDTPVVEREALGAAGRSYFLDNFESGKLTDQLLDLFETMIKRQGGN